MPRRPRFFLPGVPQHVIQRGNNRQPTFFTEADYLFYLHGLALAAKKYECRIHAYVLMTNHVHILASAREPLGISRMMQHLGRGFVQYINFTHGRTGTLWEGRFKASMVDTECYFLRCSRYIECNPLRAGMVQRPEDYRWSSYRANALGLRNDLVAPHEQYLLLGHSDSERQLAYRQLFTDTLSGEELEQIRYAANLGWPLGDERFKDEVELATAYAARPGRRGRPAREKTTDRVGSTLEIPL